jgi:hypothetical protein
MNPSFNPTLTYQTITDVDGDNFFFQNNLYYDKWGNVFLSVPTSRNGYMAPSFPVAAAGGFAIAPSNLQTVYSGIPSENLGALVQYENTTLVETSNGNASKYVTLNGSIKAAQLTGLVTDNAAQVNVGALVWDTLIPGSLMYGDDTFTIDFCLKTNVDPGTAYISILLIGDGVDSPTTPTVGSPTFSTTMPATGTSFSYSLKFDSAGPLTLTFSNPASSANPSTFTAASSSPFGKLINLMADFHIKIGVKFGGSTTGRVAKPVYCKTLVTNSIVFQDPKVTYRQVISYPYGNNPPNVRYPLLYGTTQYLQPFSDDSPWNTPIGTGATYDTSSAEWAIMRNTNAGGVSGSSFTWMQGWANGSQFVAYQALTTDPICNFFYNNRVQGNFWPVDTTSPYGVGGAVFQMRCKQAALETFQVADIIASVISPDGRWMMELGQYSGYNAGTNTHSGHACRFVDLYGPGVPWIATLGNADPNKTNYPESYRAAGVATNAGVLYGWELVNGVINHAMTMQLSPQQQKAAVFNVISATGTTAVFACTVGATKNDYSYLVPDGTTIYINGNAYTTTGSPSYNAGTGQTTVTTTATITSSNAHLYLGGTTLTAQQATQFIWPAGICDSASVTPGNAGSYQGLVPVGRRMAIPQNVNLSTIGLTTATGLIVATAFQNYGGYNVDTAFGTFSLATLGADVTRQQILDMEADAVAIRNALAICTNMTITTPNGGGSPLVAGPLPLLRV